MVEAVPIPHYRAMVAFVRQRVDAARLRYDDIEAAVRLPDRYFTKLMTQPPTRLMHPYTIFNLLDVLGLEMMIREKVPARSVVVARSKSMPSRLRISREGAWLGLDELTKNGRAGGLAYGQKVAPQRRRAIARRAARARWRNRKLPA